MVLTNSDTELVSGGWDHQVHVSMQQCRFRHNADSGRNISQQWDLNTGQVVRLYNAHAGQISSLSFRPIHANGASALQTPSPALPIHDPASAVSTGRRRRRQDSSARSRTSSPSKRANIATPADDSGSLPAAAASSSATPAVATPAEQSVAPSPAKPQVSANLAIIGSSEETRSPGFQDADMERDLNVALGLDTGQSMDLDVEPSTLARNREATAGNDDKAGSDADSLFGSGSADVEGAADADAEADLDADGEADAEGEEDDDQPLAARAARASQGNTPQFQNTLELPGGGRGPTAAAVALPSASKGSNGNAVSKQDKSNGRSQASKVTKAPFGGLTGTAGFDSDVSSFSEDILLTTTLGGQVTLFDRRVPSNPSSAADPRQGGRGIRALALPEKTPPWCASACWSPSGDRIYVGRRNETVEEWDLRMLPDAGSSHLAGKASPRFTRTLRFPAGSGPVSSLASMPNGKHLLW